MSGRLNGKIAVITGAAAGMGKATAELFVAEGAKVVLADIQAEKVKAVAARLGEQAIGVACDVTKDQDIANMIGLAASQYGGLDILFNNAAVPGSPDLVDTVTDEAWEFAMTVVLQSVLRGIRHAVPLMRARGGGSIVNTGSGAGLRAGYGQPAYSVAKAAVSHLSRSAANNLAIDNIRVNTIIPGFIATPMQAVSVGFDPETAERVAPRLEELFAQLQPLKFSGMPHDIAEACLYLASDSSRFVTGIELVVDGGLFLDGPSYLARDSQQPLSEAILRAGEPARVGGVR